MDDDTLKLAHQAGIVPGRPVTAAQLAELADLVRADEREVCAKRLEAIGCDHCAANIRARNHQPPATVADRLARHGIPMPGDDLT